MADPGGPGPPAVQRGGEPKHLQIFNSAFVTGHYNLYEVTDVPADGDCLFACITIGLGRVLSADSVM